MVDENLKDNLTSEVLEEKLVQVNRVAKVVKGLLKSIWLKYHFLYIYYFQY